MIVNDKQKMSTNDLIIGLKELMSSKMNAKDLQEAKEMIDELFYRYLIKPNIKGKGRA